MARCSVTSARISALTALVLSLSASVHAEPSAADKETARSLMDQGDASFASQDLEGALRAYLAADQIMGVPTTGVEVAKAQEALGRLVEARDALLRVTRYPKSAGEPKAFTQAREQASERARVLSQRIPSLTVQLTGMGDAKTTIEVDGHALRAGTVGLPRKLNPGKHTIVAKAPGFDEARREIVLKEGADETVRLEMKRAVGGSSEVSEPVPSTAPEPGAESTTSTLTYVGFGVAGVGVTVGAITGLLAYSRTGDAKDQCTDNLCPSSASSDIDGAKSMGNVSTVSFAVGLVGAAVGVVGLLNPTEPDTTRASVGLQPTLGLGQVGLTGRF